MAIRSIIRSVLEYCCAALQSFYPFRRKAWRESRKGHWKLSSTRFQLKARFKDPQGQDARWNCMREAIHSSAMSAFNRIERPSHDWLNPNLPIVEPLIEAKRQALLEREISDSAVQLKALLDNIVPTTIGLNFATN